MVTIPGASGFLNAATLANQQGLPAGQATVLGEGGIGTVSLLDVGRNNSSGIGLSARARLLNNQFIESNSSTFNQIFSLGLGSTATIEGLQQEILALRSRVPDSGLSREILANAIVAADEAASEPTVGVDPAEAAADAEVEAIKQALTDRVQTTLASLSSAPVVDTEA